MRLKTYRAGTMAEALAQVKKDLGKDAVILHTRSYKRGAVLGFGGKSTVEITASVDVVAPSRLGPIGPLPATSATPAASTPPSRLTPTAIGKAYGLPTPGVEHPQMTTTPASPSAPLAGRPEVPAGQTVPVVGGRDATQPAPSTQVAHEMRAELAAIKAMVGQVLQTAGSVGAAVAVSAAPMPAALVDHYVKLIQADVARELADAITASVRGELSAAELADPSIVRAAVLRRIEAMLPACNTPLPCRPAGNGEDRPLIIALIGPTGVGKTTTVAKLAAAYRLRHGKKVGLITADTYRIAAVDQLRTYANIIGLPLKVVLTPAEMQQAVADLTAAGVDAILIDTAGRSPSDSPRLAELAEHLDAARPHQTHLVLSSVLGDAAMLRAVERFQQLEPDHVIFTKLDEAASYGVLLNIAARLDASLAYVTTGQEVPDDIEPGRADRLARCILDGLIPR